MKHYKSLLTLLLLTLSLTHAEKAHAQFVITKAERTSPTCITITLADGQRRVVDFYGDDVFRIYQDPNGRPIHDPQAQPEAKILVDHPRRPVSELSFDADAVSASRVEMQTKHINLSFSKSDGLMQVIDRKSGKVVVRETAPVKIESGKVTFTCAEGQGYFYGGGVQNGRFSHKGQIIKIVNQNSWTDGGVASPCPFFWSTEGYGMMFHTFRPGQYDFGATKKGSVVLEHNEDYLDLFVMVGSGLQPLYAYYQLTGEPVLLPKFGFYEGHLNAYNRDYWKPSEGDGGILFEDGKRYVESQKADGGGVQESLNGEKDNYQFSARAVIDRYAKHDMPLGWILPNDGYGAGYGQEQTLDGNIENLKSFGDYARSKGVEIGLWTQSDLHPIDSIKPLLQRDIEKEIGCAGVRVLKTDVAWVGAGYSFGLNGISEVAQLMPKLGGGARPFIITLDGWAGTQRYGGVWTGDQTGGKWEYIRFHIPTYIGAGLSGMPNICSDMDGIFGGKNMPVNVRDFQWKTFTPMQLNMDGWGSNEKYPHAMGEPATSINRNYLKIRSILMPYIYTVAHQAVSGEPMIRAMFLEEPNAYTLGKQTQYQFMFGPWLLVAPVYQDTEADEQGNDIRNGIYLPRGLWYDMFTGKQYEGGCIFNNYDAPIWKLPLFVKAGAIIPVTYAHNNPNQIRRGIRSYECFPYGETDFTEYEDDGKTDAYLHGDTATTHIHSSLQGGVARITIDKTMGHYEGMEKTRALTLTFNVSKRPKSVTAKLGGKKVKLTETQTMEEFRKHKNAYLYTEDTNMNNYSTPGTPAAEVKLKACPVVYVRMDGYDITAKQTEVTVKGYEFNIPNGLLRQEGSLQAPRPQVAEEDRKAYSLTPSWEAVPRTDFYEIQSEGMLYSGIRQTHLLFEDLQPETDYVFKVRAVNKSGHSEWAELTSKTNVNPLEFAIRGITATCTAEAQPGGGLRKLFDLDENTMWHTKWQTKATPFDIVIDLHSVNTLDRMEYLPRQIGVNGMITVGDVAYSMDKTTWTPAGEIRWTRDMKKKTFSFPTHPTARYIRLHVEKAYGDFGSGQELYIFRQEGTPFYIPGDINNDNVLDENDLTSYMNYTGLRQGDKDFEGYVSKGDINGNGLIDVYDISNVAVMIGQSEGPQQAEPVEGHIFLQPDKARYAVGDVASITVRALGFKNVNALSFALPYSPAAYEYVGTEPLAVGEMDNFTNDRLHSNGQKALYPTFVNVGRKPMLSGSTDLFVLRFKVLKAGPFSLTMKDAILVDRQLFAKVLDE